MITFFDWFRWALAAEIRSPLGMAVWVRGMAGTMGKLVTLHLCFDIEMNS
jgi:hypothetical protein